ncbi:pentatricopeptide repeat-containing protein At1g11290, chloroplastic-like [Magnolia sinica]|uniref:pentatricopeptide repeat-containing protein At1g11290, chloroplastic-like n=1 Tax=Magnolia sinica TaxID=86752 RepID=UPI00265A1C3A|nr:pentatricopeptide repeat-containing protein At1g11290, chloroplastic-like [Magnolia sinica]
MQIQNAWCAIRHHLLSTNQCTPLKTLKSIHASMLRSHLDLNLFLSTHLISKYALLNSMNYAFAIFSSSNQTPDVFLWNVLIRGFADNGQPDRAISLYHQMRAVGVSPDNFTFPFVFKACANLRDVEEGEKIHADAAEFGYEFDIFVGNSAVSMYGKCGRFETAREVFDKMPERNVVSWSVMIAAYVESGCFEDAMGLFWRMLEERIRPNRVTILNLIPCVCRKNEADEIYRIVVENGLDSDICIRNALMGMYAKCRRVDIARIFFDGIPEKDLVSWSSMIEAYVQADLPIEGLELFKQMKLKRVRPDYVTGLSVVRVCSNLASLRQAKFAHGFIIRSLFNHKVVIETALVDLYVKCGSLEYARRVFDSMRERNLVSWSTMISGYGMHGRGKVALELFDWMKGSMDPDHITFVSLLSACSHAGLIAEGWQCFNSMIRDFHIMPRTEHYACMVDLLGRAGQLNEAREFIENMPIKPDAGVWGALLGACRIHSNVKLAELAAKSLFELDPENSGRYVLLSNIYMFSGKREEADKVWGLMKRRGVKKTAGHTVIEVKNKVYTFLVGDRSNPQTDLIYEELDRLMERIREEGYVPNTNFVLHDVEDEMKEKMLYVHSEKLAIVFGLLNSGPGSTIRIKKNLRVCGDCHTATKFISKVTGREIVVRDAHRFHHFNGGMCSCGDYW